MTRRGDGCLCSMLHALSDRTAPLSLVSLQISSDGTEQDMYPQLELARSHVQIDGRATGTTAVEPPSAKTFDTG